MDGIRKQQRVGVFRTPPLRLLFSGTVEAAESVLSSVNDERTGKGRLEGKMVVKRLGGKSYQFALLTWNSKDPASPLLEGELKSNPSNQTVLHVRFRCTLVEMAAGSLLALAIPSILAQLLESQGFNFALMLIVCLPVGYVAFLSLFRLSWKLRQPKMELMLEVLQKHGFVGDEAV